MNAPARGAKTEIGEALRKRRALFGLLRDDRHRRDLLTLFAINFRALVGWKFIAAFAFLLGLAAYVITQYASDAFLSYEVLQVAFGLAATGAGATMYSGERQGGTFELLWLATGSEKGLLRMKIITVLIALALIIAPSIVVASKLVGGALPFGKTFAFLLVNTFLILAVMTLVGTYLPQAWAGALLGAALLAAVYVSLLSVSTMLNPFLNPFQPGTANRAPSVAAVVVNRLIYFFLALFLIGSAARRLRKSF